MGRFNDRFVLVYIDNTPVAPAFSEELVSQANDPVILLPETPAPDVVEPVTTDPVVTDPIAIVPEAPSVIISDPIVTEPAVNEPVAIIPEIPDAVVTEPVVTEPVAIIPEITDTIVTEPVVTDPIAAVPEVLAPIVTNVKQNGGKGKAVFVSVNNSQVTINSTEEAITDVFVYTMGQMQLFAGKNINTNEFVIPSLGVVNQVLIIKTQLKNGKWSTNKIVL